MLAGPYARDMGAGNRILQARSSSTRMRRLRWAVCCARAACAVSCASLVGSPALRRRWVGAATWVSRSRSAGSLRRRTVVLARSEPADPGDGRCATARVSIRLSGASSSEACARSATASSCSRPSVRPDEHARRALRARHGRRESNPASSIFVHARAATALGTLLRSYGLCGVVRVSSAH